MSTIGMLRAGAAAQQGARRHRTLYLLNYALATFARSSEGAAADPRSGWAFDIDTPWPGTDVPRILSDGAILIEGSRTNGLIYSSDWNQIAWQKIAETPTFVSAAYVAPDGGAAQSIDWPDGTPLCEMRSTFAAPDNVDLTGSIYLHRPTGAGSANIDVGLRNKTPTVQTATRSVPEGWTRYNQTQNTATGATTPIMRLMESSTGIVFGAWVAQLEVGSFPSSPIRTSGSSATRAAEACSFATPPAAMLSGHWSLSVWPEYASSEAPATAYLLYLDANNYLAIVSGTTIRLRAGGVDHDITGLSYARYTELRIEVQHDNAMTLTGGGGGSVALNDNWTASSAALVIGSDGSTNHAFAVIGRPVRA